MTFNYVEYTHKKIYSLIEKFADIIKSCNFKASVNSGLFYSIADVSLVGNSSDGKYNVVIVHRNLTMYSSNEFSELDDTIIATDKNGNFFLQRSFPRRFPVELDESIKTYILRQQYDPLKDTYCSVGEFQIPVEDRNFSFLLQQGDVLEIGTYSVSVLSDMIRVQLYCESSISIEDGSQKCTKINFNIGKGLCYVSLKHN
jgi:hypothetical protein